VIGKGTHIVSQILVRTKHNQWTQIKVDVGMYLHNVHNVNHMHRKMALVTPNCTTE